VGARAGGNRVKLDARSGAGIGGYAPRKGRGSLTPPEARRETLLLPTLSTRR
jgi:hypothetical protein